MGRVVSLSIIALAFEVALVTADGPTETSFNWAMEHRSEITEGVFGDRRTWTSEAYRIGADMFVSLMVRGDELRDLHLLAFFKAGHPCGVKISVAVDAPVLQQAISLKDKTRDAQPEEIARRILVTSVTGSDRDLERLHQLLEAFADLRVRACPSGTFALDGYEFEILVKSGPNSNSYRFFDTGPLNAESVVAGELPSWCRKVAVQVNEWLKFETPVAR